MLELLLVSIFAKIYHDLVARINQSPIVSFNRDARVDDRYPASDTNNGCRK